MSAIYVFNEIILGDEVAKHITESVPERTVASSNLDHGWLLSLDRQLSRERERGRHLPTGHGKTLRVLILKFCQN